MSDVLPVPADPVADVDGAWLRRLREAARASPRRRARLCLHGSPADAVQEMVIALERGTLLRPHRHPGSESLHLLEGAALVLILDEDGGVRRRLRLEPEGTRLFRLAPRTWHTLLPASDLVLVHEVAEGPYDPAAQEFLPCAPAAEGPALAAWLERLGEVR